MHFGFGTIYISNISLKGVYHTSYVKTLKKKPGFMQSSVIVF